MYSTRTGLILGFHGCDQSIVHKVLTGETGLKPSTNVKQAYDVLEANYKAAKLKVPENKMVGREQFSPISSGIY
ncbi:MAG TPA: hypothetical protein VGS79_04795 [Puia sp.]|nr:hypothetical protein [Puia sp.]